MKEAVTFIVASSKGCGVVVGVLFAGRNKFFNVGLQIAPWQGFHNIQPNQYKEKQQIGLRRQKASHIPVTYIIHRLNC